MAIAIVGNDGNPLTTRDIDGSAENFVLVTGRLTFSGSYVTGGDTLDWTTVAGIPIPSQQCLQVAIWSQGGLLTVTYAPIGTGATALNAWKVKITSAAFGTELAAGAYPGAITADIVVFQAVFRKLLQG